MEKGTFVISLDFELAWGIRDQMDPLTYADNLKGVYTALPRMLDLFSQYGIHATFAAVGFLFFNDKNDLLLNLPDKKPGYKNKILSPYNGYFNSISEYKTSAELHFAPELVRRIQNTHGIELGTHTFSHYYCMEPGQTAAEFRDDINAVAKTAKRFNTEMVSLVFPRNQFNTEYLGICKEAGILCYRGNELSWLHPGDRTDNTNRFRRMMRLLDAYLNLSGHNCHHGDHLNSQDIINVPASRFLRPFNPKLKFLDELKFRRIRNSMDHAAKTNTMYHLWWHPHNFGIHQDENFAFLEKILKHFKTLEKKYGMVSMNMAECAKAIANNG